MSETDEIERGVVEALDRLGVVYELVRIDPQFADTAQFCERYGYPLDHCGNAIIVASKRGPKRYSACVVGGSDRLDVNRTVRRLMEVSRASFASPDETMELTGMMIGGVTPVSLPPGLPIYVDRKLLDVEYLILGSGSRSSKLKLAPSELGKLPGLEFVAGLSMERRQEG